MYPFTAVSGSLDHGEAAYKTITSEHSRETVHHQNPQFLSYLGAFEAMDRLRLYEKV